jgi:multidrug efflux pump subunit AcrA (membrane-fusion protein)
MNHFRNILQPLRSSVVLIALLSPTLLFVGCGRKDDIVRNSSAAQHASDVGISYSVKDGLLVSAETAKFIGLETTEVSERPIATTRVISGRVFRVATTNEPQALASALISANEAALLRPGLASVQMPSSPIAKILQLDSSGAGQSGIVEAILQLDDPERTLADGAFVNARFAAGDTNSVIVIPNAALFHTTAGDFVYLENGTHFARATVKPGRTDGEVTEIIEGLFTGDKVVIRPVMTLWMTELHNVNGGDACCIKQEAK